MTEEADGVFKLTKYEFRKNIYGLCIMLGIIAIAQLYFLYEYNFSDNRYKVTGGALVLMLSALVCFVMVFALGVMTYSRELSSRTSYLVFMTPNSSIKIIGSKLVFTFFCGFIIALLLGGLGTIDMYMLLKLWDEEISMVQMIVEVLGNFGFSVVEIAYNLASAIISFLVTFFMVVTLAYLSITMSATVLQNKKIKGLISVVLFLAVLWAVTRVGGLLPRLYETPENMTQAIVSMLPQTIFYLLVMAGSIAATAQLLERKVSL